MKVISTVLGSFITIVIALVPGSCPQMVNVHGVSISARTNRRGYNNGNCLEGEVLDPISNKCRGPGGEEIDPLRVTPKKSSKTPKNPFFTFLPRFSIILVLLSS